GNLYIADSDNRQIRKVDAISGIITAVVDVSGMMGFTGDGGPAPDAQINDAYGIALDGAGNIYIADTDNHRIRKVQY
ncbi:MAG: hypothetical protein HY692_02735, partial [Cyanobacteria bacterium NC_groundwater_1444_Ag_S-0.65um_54_12]|nr:hypothetical protein [Cyanobacteria bacterium NC_groundwater_1444_Ag_S-0.65um_54_12]